MHWKEPQAEPTKQNNTIKKFSLISCPNCEQKATVSKSGKTDCSFCGYTDYPTTWAKSKIFRTIMAGCVLLFALLMLLS